MSAGEWVEVEAAIDHIAKVYKCSRVHARQYLLHSVAAERIAVIDRDGNSIDLNMVTELEEVVFSKAILFSKADLEYEYPIFSSAKSEAPTPQAPPPSREGVGGAALQFRWDRIAGEVFRRVWVDGLSKTNTDLALEMFEWCEREFGPGKAPDPETLRKYIGRWLKGVRAEELRR